MDKSTKQNQIKRTFEAFKERPKTMLEVAKETGILRGNICRYVDHFRKHRKIVEVKQGKCPISKHPATFYSTDPAFFPPETELELFDIPEPKHAGAYSQ